MNKQKSKTNLATQRKIKSSTSFYHKHKPQQQSQQSKKLYLQSDQQNALLTDFFSKQPSKANENISTTAAFKSKFQSEKLSKSNKQQHKIYGEMICYKSTKSNTSITPQRPGSRLSNKRGSNISTNSNKNILEGNFKENNPNHKNQNLKCSIIINKLKKQPKTAKSNKKNQSKHQLKPATDLVCKEPSKKPTKSQNLHVCQKIVPKFPNQKDIFSQKILIQTKTDKKSSQQKLNKKINDKIYSKIKKQSNQKQNLLQIYKFYKKTFDINFTNCIKKGSSISSLQKSQQNLSKSAIKLTHSSTIIPKNQQNKFFGEKHQVQGSSLLESRSKSRNSIAHSQNSTKDNIWGNHIDKVCNGLINDSRKCKKLSKQVGLTSNIIQEQNLAGVSKKMIKKQYESQVTLIEEQQTVYPIKIQKQFRGSNNIDFSKWPSAETENSQEKKTHQNAIVSDSVCKLTQLFGLSRKSEHIFAINQNLSSVKNTDQKQPASELLNANLNFQSKVELKENLQFKDQENELIFSQRKMENELSSLAQLSSISLLDDCKQLGPQNSQRMTFENEDAAFHL